MITAEEARKRAEAKYEQEVKAELDEIDKVILAAVDKCETSVVIFHNIHAETANRLKGLGPFSPLLSAICLKTNQLIYKNLIELKHADITKA